jgi:hypothetical protein
MTDSTEFIGKKKMQHPRARKKEAKEDHKEYEDEVCQTCKEGIAKHGELAEGAEHMVARSTARALRRAPTAHA